MTFLPIVERELRVRARQPLTYRLRGLAAGVALALALPTLFGTFSTPVLMGQRLFRSLSMLALLYCLFEGARQTADCLSGEKREGTLGLLFLTNLQGDGLVLGKLAAASLNSFYSLLAVLPVLGLPVLAGGVTGGEFARMTLVLAVTLFFTLAVGMWVSSWSREEMKALFTALAVVAGTTLLLPLLDFFLHWRRFSPAVAGLALGSPGMAWDLAFDQAYRATPRPFWLSLGIIHTLSWMLLAAAAALAHRSLREDNPASVKRAEPPVHVTTPHERLVIRWWLLESNPVHWLARRQRGVQIWIWLVAAALAVLPVAHVVYRRLFGFGGLVLGWGLFGYAQLVAFFAVRFLIAFLACRFLADARRSGLLELLLCTPLRRDDILRGQRLAVRDQLFWPVLIALLIPQCAAYGLRFGHSSTALVDAVIAFCGQAIVLAADALALCWFGAWAALRSKRPATAVAKTFAVVVVVPWLLTPLILSFGLVPPAGLARLRVLWLPFLFVTSVHTLLALVLDGAFIWWAKRQLGVRSRHSTFPASACRAWLPA